MFVTISFWALIYGSALAFSDGAEVADEVIARAGAGFGLALVLVPAVFAAAAFASSRIDAPVMVLAGMGISLAVGLPLLILRNPAAALITGYAAGAVVTLSRPDGWPLRNRWIAAAVVGVVAHLGLLFLPAPTAWVAPALPFTAMGLADALTRHEPGQRAAAGDAITSDATD